MIHSLTGSPPFLDELISFVYCENKGFAHKIVELSPHTKIRPSWPLEIVSNINLSSTIFFTPLHYTDKRKIKRLSINEVLEFYSGSEERIESFVLDNLHHKLSGNDIDFSTWIYKTSKPEKLRLLGLNDYDGNLLDLFLFRNENMQNDLERKTSSLYLYGERFKEFNHRRRKP